jgi:hypothetical protein
LFVFSCGSGEPGKTNPDSVPQQAQATVLKKGDYTELSVNGNPSNAFSVYLPSSYDTAKKYALVIFFDAHGNGKLPMEKYKSLAEKWNYIFIGSNSSKNGMNGNETTRIGNELIAESKRILRVNENEIMLCGFSGGARVASNIALTNNAVKGVICNSAAPQQPVNGKIFVGLAGLGDMNYLEMKTFESNQPANTSPHELLVFDGKHEWAPVQMMEDALLICSTYNINSRVFDRDAYQSDALEDALIAQADSIKKTSCFLANNLLQTALRTEGKPSPGDTLILRRRRIESIAAAFKNNNCVKTDAAAWIAAEKEETVLQQELASAIMSQDTTWWKINSPKYFESKKEGADKFMHQRLRGYASLVCYSYANQAFKSNNLHAAEKLVAVYAIVDPENSEWAYMRASLYMKLGLNDYALSSLEKAVELGFKDRSRLQSDPVFSPIAADARFAAVLGKMN